MAVKFTFYATVDADSIRDYMPSDVAYLFPASSFARYGLKPLRLPAHITQRAADSGGFVATFKWGDYRYNPDQYVTWLHSWQPQWAATMDYCCEDEITSGNRGVVRERQQKTTEMAWHFWKMYRNVTWCWVPTIQGWTVADYERHATEMKPLIDEMCAHYGKESMFRVGIGTLCRRASSQMIRDVVLAVSRILPDVPLHLWGVKLSVLQSSLALPESVVSVDSAAWNGLQKRGRTRYHASGKTQRRYVYEDALPAYLDKIRASQNALKQGVLL